MTPAFAVALFVGCAAFSAGLLWIGWHARAWWAARRAVRDVDVEYAVLVDTFGDDGLWP